MAPDVAPSAAAPGLLSAPKTTPLASQAPVAPDAAPFAAPPGPNAPPLASLEPHAPVAAGVALPSLVKPVPDNRAALLFAQGVDAENRGDFSAARRYYSSAAQRADGAAARSLGRLYDPAFPRRSALGGIDPDPAQARLWYERAVQLGDTEAGRLLGSLSAR